MTGSNNFETSDLVNAHRGNAESESEARILTQGKVDDRQGPTPPLYPNS